MRVLVACEFSGTVRDAFAAKGHDAWSCDLLPTERPGNHYEGDVLQHLSEGWDLMIAHPPCTYLCSSGLHWNHRTPGRDQLTEEALAFVKALLNAPIPKIALENPTGRINTAIAKPTQKVQPWQFGHDASKGTCLWLKGLEKLKATKIIAPKGWQQVVYAADLVLCDCCEEAWCNLHGDHYSDCSCIGPTEDDVIRKVIDGYEFGTRENPAPKPVWGNQTPSGQNKLGPSADRWKERSKTYQGIADAMAEQWGQ